MKKLSWLLLLLLLSPEAVPSAHAQERPVYTLEKAVYDTVTWQRPRFESRRTERNRLVETGIIRQGVTDSAVVEAMRHVPRHLFMPKKVRDYAYRNRPLPIGYEQTISQPFIVGYMSALLNLKPGEKVLEIGTGSGYQAAVLSELTPHVFTIEIVEELGRQARKRFEKLGYTTIKTRIGDGYKGWPKYAPFDAIILTAAADEIPEPLARQLKTGGILVMPKGKEGETQILITAVKKEDGTLNIDRRLRVRFVPMTGEIQDHR